LVAVGGAVPLSVFAARGALSVVFAATLGMMACRSSARVAPDGFHSVSATPSSARSARPTLHLVTIGIEHYGSSALRQSGAEADTRRVAESLAGVATPFYRLIVHRLAGGAATRSAVMATLDSVREKAAESDLVMLYYRGLGGPRFLVLADSQAMPGSPSAPGAAPPAAFEARLLRPEALADWLLSLRTRQLFLVLEAPEAASYFHTMRERLAAPEGATRATKDLVALATPGVPTALDFASGPSGVLTAAVTESLDEEREARGLSLVSRLLPRVLYKLDAPIVVHEAGAELVLGAAHDAAAAADALRDDTPWAACSVECPTIRIERVDGCCTLVGDASSLARSAQLFVNGRLARRDGMRFAVELPPAALRTELTLRVLHADHRRYEFTQRLP
jgi:hypothetical protein